MLKLFDDLEPFFTDNYRRINVREYARIMKTTPPTASKLLAYYHEEGLLNKEEDRNYIFYAANNESFMFIHLTRAYWHLRLEKAGIKDYLEKELISPLVILFGSCSKAEIKKDSDIDIAIFASSQKNISLEIFEKKLNRKIHLFQFKKRDDIGNPELLNNILNGFILMGGW
ncbi:MAG: nucleotidyltransferase domain-containing protein [archaeon]